ncbi:MAG TPA: hypothetical protein VKV15_06300 [Bryobacteraceae bacterium]|nr:hypothetical protein [Bryobacteraceae bacterium]
MRSISRIATPLSNSRTTKAGGSFSSTIRRPPASVRLSTLILLAASAVFGQYKAEPAGPPPADIPANFASLLVKNGTKIVGANGSAVCSIWLRAEEPKGPKSTEDNVTLPLIPQGALLGVIQFPTAGADRRGQTIKPGIYTLRYSDFPVNGDHQGVAPQRDFMLLSPISIDKDPAATPNFDALVDMSRKASGTPHPAVLSIWKQDTDFQPGFSLQGEHDWVLQTKLGDTPLAIILIGKVQD